ncbi:tyrosine-type recombinase/integrase [Gluconobacter cerinus]|uniref:tyrosine-type recombinase/integrase n=1 Tax=Gluconobacter cerinus TaxID=38307 RepID=UPI001B8BE224|nr:tyrosine-type recombinase/integrase [Gluconobacter cerinus]MBS1034919.1 tyrosine-type recombinase/integrase [Gluconobacter cerinus]
MTKKALRDDDMHGLRRTGGLTWSVRLSIPRDRWTDAGKAFRTATGIKQELIRSLGTRDKQEAIKRRDKALAAMREDLDTRLVAAGLLPIHGHWQPDWMKPENLIADALDARRELQSVSERADDDFDDNLQGPSDPRRRMMDGMDLMLDDRTEQLNASGKDGGKYYRQFREIALGEVTPFADVLDRWTAVREKEVSPASLASARASLKHFAAYLAEVQGHDQPLNDPVVFLRSQNMDDIPLPVIGGFVEWLGRQNLHLKTIQGAISPLKMLWEWSIRTHILKGPNPWVGATTGLKRQIERVEKSKPPEEREYHTAELVRLLKTDPSKGKRRDFTYGAAICDLLRLSLFTGARENELASLTVGRVINRDRTDGPLLGIAVTDEEAKTANSVRRVPLHPIVQPIIERRLRAVDQCDPDAPLFPDCKPGGVGMKRAHFFSQRFTDFRRAVLGRESDGELNFHSLRKNFGTYMGRADRAGVSECKLSVTQKLIGHKAQSLTEAVYMERELEWDVYSRAILGMVDKGMPDEVKEAV